MVMAVRQVYIEMIKAFKADCATLIDKFKNETIKDVKTFLNIWESLNFSLVYDIKYTKHGAEVDFKHDTLQITKLIMLRDHFVGGMFLLYGLYCLQDNPSEAIRLELDELHYILRSLKFKKEKYQLEYRQAALLFCVLLKENAFDFVVFGRQYDMEGQLREEMIFDCNYGSSDCKNVKKFRHKEWLNNFTQNIIPKDMMKLDIDYLMAKMKVKESFPHLNLSLDMVQEDLTTTFLKSLGSEADGTDKPRVTANSIGARRQSLKHRKLNRMKHRYQSDIDTLEESVPDEAPTTLKRKRGLPTGQRKSFINKLINDPDLGTSSDDSSSSLLHEPPKSGYSLPSLY